MAAAVARCAFFIAQVSLAFRTMFVGRDTFSLCKFFRNLTADARNNGCDAGRCESRKTYEAVATTIIVWAVSRCRPRVSRPRKNEGTVVSLSFIYLFIFSISYNDLLDSRRSGLFFGSELARKIDRSFRWKIQLARARARALTKIRTHIFYPAVHFNTAVPYANSFTTFAIYSTALSFPSNPGACNKNKKQKRCDAALHENY